MDHIDFVLWVVGWGFFVAFTNNNNNKATAAPIGLVIKVALWIFIGWKLWN